MPKYDNSGALFKADKKGNAEWADYSGNITVNGVEYWLSAWIKEGKSGKFMSLRVKPKTAPAAKRSAQPAQDTGEIPFANPYKGRVSYVV